MSDEDAGYPTRAELRKIKNWKMKDGWIELAKYIQSIWHWGDEYAYFVNEEDHNFELHTGGWSGNEEMVDALKKSSGFFWMFCWVESRRGGHYKFMVKDIK